MQMNTDEKNENAPLTAAGWMALVILGAFFFIALWYAVKVWTSMAGVHMSGWGWFTLILGIVVTTALGGGRMDCRRDHLDELTRDRELAAFVLYSSASGTLGGIGQSNYAAANTFVDALAAQRRARGQVATSIAWGLWQPSGTGLTGRLTQADLARISKRVAAEYPQTNAKVGAWLIPLHEQITGPTKPALLALSIVQARWKTSRPTTPASTAKKRSNRSIPPSITSSRKPRASSSIRSR